jgi:hypothetical protein
VPGSLHWGNSDTKHPNAKWSPQTGKANFVWIKAACARSMRRFERWCSFVASAEVGRAWTKGNSIMFTTNEGNVDRVFRVLIGAALIVWFFMDQGTGFWHFAKLIGVVPLLTGLVGNCPAYSIFGVSTCSMK